MLNVADGPAYHYVVIFMSAEAIYNAMHDFKYGSNGNKGAATM